VLPAATVLKPPSRPPLDKLVRQFEQDASIYRALIRDSLDDGWPRFVEDAIPLLKGELDLPGTQYVVSLLAANELLLELFRRSDLSTPQALALARAAQVIDSMTDVKLARTLSSTLVTSEGSVDMPEAARLLEILEEISVGTRIMPSLIRLMRHSDPRLRSKAVLMVGRANKSPGWLRQRLAETDPRVRANAIEALWGIDSDTSRQILQAMLQDPSSRVAANAIVGLYQLGESSAVAELAKMAAHQSPMFRASAGWAIGQTADCRFADTLARMLQESNVAVRRQAFASLPRLKARVAAEAQSRPTRLSARLLDPVGHGFRRMSVLVDRVPGQGEPRLLATHFILSEDTHPVMNYRVMPLEAPESSTVVVLIPIDGPAPERWADVVLRWLPSKRTTDVWAPLPYISKDFEMTGHATEPEAPVFRSTPDEIAAEFRKRTLRSACTGLWRSIWYAIRAAAPFPSVRKLIVLHPPEVSGTPGPELIAAAQVLPSQIQVVSSGEAEPLERFCRVTGANWASAGDDESLAELVSDACFAITPNYELQWEPVVPAPCTVRLRVRSPLVCGQATVEVPTPSSLRRV
jgi:hypothetical protein